MSHKEVAEAATKPSRDRTARTRKALCGALLELLEEQPFEQIKVKEITSRAGVGYATFFRRYGDKDGLLHELASQEIQRLLSLTLPIMYSVDSRASTQALCAYVWEHRRVWKALLTGGASAILKEEYLNQALQLAREQGDSETWLPGELAVATSVTVSVEVLSWWLRQEQPVAVGEVTNFLHHLAIAPVLSEVDPSSVVS